MTQTIPIKMWRREHSKKTEARIKNCDFCHNPLEVKIQCGRVLEVDADGVLDRSGFFCSDGCVNKMWYD